METYQPIRMGWVLNGSCDGSTERPWSFRMVFPSGGWCHVNVASVSWFRWKSFDETGHASMLITLHPKSRWFQKKTNFNQGKHDVGQLVPIFEPQPYVTVDSCTWQPKKCKRVKHVNSISEIVILLTISESVYIICYVITIHLPLSCRVSAAEP